MSKKKAASEVRIDEFCGIEGYPPFNSAINPTTHKHEECGAIFSPCRVYRYDLWRRWHTGCGEVAFIGLNPSTADETQNDPTIRRCIGFAKAWGFSGLHMLNLFAFRATNPKVMKAAAEPIGPENDEHIKGITKECLAVIAAWGTHGVYCGRGDQIRKLLPELHYLRLTKGGFPEHPLYLPKDLRFKKWI